MTFQILQYGTLIAIFLTMIASYNKYKKGEFSLENEDEIIENPATFKQWSKEIFIIRPRKRPLLSIIPQIGIVISMASLLIYPVWLYGEYFNPIQPLKKLTKYQGKIIGYKYNRKSSDRLIVQLDDGEIKSFLGGVTGKKEYMDSKLNKNITVLTQRERGFLEEGEAIRWIQYNHGEIDIALFNKHYNRVQKYEKADLWLLTTPLKFLLFFLILLWFVNRNPVKTNPKGVENSNN